MGVVPQQVLSGKYRLERELGRGGMGSVWLAQHLTLRSSVALKLIDPEIAQNPEALSRFLREAQSAASLRSPHVVQILDHGVDEGIPFIVMELLEGESLAGRIERAGRLSPSDVSRIMTQVARAMTKAHEAGIVHRDLKPDNIFLVRNDEEEIAKVLDFGIAKAQSLGSVSVSSATRTGSVLGTPYYMSPEQAEGAKSVDQRTDIWAMGVIACECLIGSRPFEGETLGSLLLAICAREMPVPSRLGAVPAGFDAWFSRACARDVSQRFASARQAAAELRQVCSGVSSGDTIVDIAPVSGRAAVAAASLPLASTTAQLGLSGPNQPARTSAVPWLGLAVGLVSLGVLGVGGFMALRSSDPGAEATTQRVAPAPLVTSVATSADAPDLGKPTTSAEVPSTSLSSSAAPPPTPPPRPPSQAVNKPRAVVEKPKPAALSPARPSAAAAPAAPPPAAAPPPPPTAKPRVNLGI